MKKVLTIGASIATLLLSSGAVAQEAKPLTKPEIEAIVKEFILNNPEVMIQSFEQHQVKQAEERQKKAKDNISSRKADLLENKMSPTAGNPNGDVSLVYFFDYNCGFCKRVHPTIEALLKEDKKLKIIFKELPILGPSSDLTARYALAVNKIDPKKYYEYHSELMKFTGEKNETSLTDLAKKIGIDEARLKTEAGSKEIADYLSKLKEVAQSIGLSGTPAFVIGDDFIPGAVDKQTLSAKIAELRK